MRRGKKEKSKKAKLAGESRFIKHLFYSSKGERDSRGELFESQHLFRPELFPLFGNRGASNSISGWLTAYPVEQRDT